jgi:DNA replication protein DnaC
MISIGGRDFCKTCASNAYERAQKEHMVSVNTMVREKHLQVQ